jgi:hypothetical protein
MESETPDSPIPEPGESHLCTCETFDYADSDIGPALTVELDPHCRLHGIGTAWGERHGAWDEPDAA